MNDPKKFIEDILKDPPDFTLTFNGPAADKDGKFICDYLKIPHINCLVDSAIRFVPLILSPYNIISCVDRDSCDLIKGFSFDRVFFMPHGVERSLDFNPEGKRKYDVLIPSTFIDYESIDEKWKEKYSSQIREAIHKAIEITQNNDSIPYFSALSQATDHATPTMFNEMEMYIRGLEHVNLVKSIHDAEVHIIGAGNTKDNWEKYIGKKQKNIKFHKEVSFEKMLDFMKQAKIILNSCAWIRNGGHERIFAGMACGAAVVTAENPYLKDNFTDNKNILFYNYKTMSRINENINKMLSNEDARQTLAVNGREQVIAHHTWDNRAQTLLENLNELYNKVPSRKK